MASTVQPATDQNPTALIKRFDRNFASLITTSLGVTAALSFNDAIKSMFEKGGVFEKVGKRGVWYTAIFITLLAFAATFLFTRRYPDLEPSTKKNPITV